MIAGEPFVIEHLNRRTQLARDFFFAVFDLCAPVFTISTCPGINRLPLIPLSRINPVTVVP